MNENKDFHTRKALSALDIAAAKLLPVNRWDWANLAAGHAAQLGICDAEALLGDGAMPDLDALRQALAHPTPATPHNYERLYITNRFFSSSLGLTPESPRAYPAFTLISTKEARQLVKSATHLIPAIHFGDLAVAVGHAFNIEMRHPYDAHITLTEPNSAILLAKYYGPPILPQHLPELPVRGRLEFILVEARHG